MCVCVCVCYIILSIYNSNTVASRVNVMKSDERVCGEGGGRWGEKC